MKKKINMKDYVTPEEAAKISGASIATIYRTLRSGKLEGVEQKGHRFVSRASLQKWCEPKPIEPEEDVDYERMRPDHPDNEVGS